MALTKEDLTVITQFLERVTCYGSGEANSLVIIMNRIAQAYGELDSIKAATPPPAE